MSEPINFTAFKAGREITANANTAPQTNSIIAELVAIVTEKATVMHREPFEPDSSIVKLDDFKVKKDKVEGEEFDHFASGIALDTAAGLVDMLEEFGYDPYDNPESVKCLMMMVESIKAFLYKIKGRDYMLQPVIDHYIRIEGDTTPEEILNFILDTGDE